MDKLWLSHDEKKRYNQIYKKLNNHKHLSKDKLSKFIIQRTLISSAKTQIIVQKAFNISKEQDQIDQVGFFYLMKYVAYIQDGGSENEDIINIQRALPLPVITESKKSEGSEIKSNNSSIQINKSLENSKVSGEAEEEQKVYDNIEDKQEEVQNLQKTQQIQENLQKQNKMQQQLLVSDDYQNSVGDLQNHKQSDSFIQNESFLQGSNRSNNDQQVMIKEQMMQEKQIEQNQKNELNGENEQKEAEEENKQQQDDKQVPQKFQDQRKHEKNNLELEKNEENKQDQQIEEEQYQQIDLNDDNKVNQNLQDMKLISSQSAPQNAVQSEEVLNNKQRTMTFGISELKYLQEIILEDEQQQQQQAQNSILQNQELNNEQINLKQSQQSANPNQSQQLKQSDLTFGIQSQEQQNISKQIESNIFSQEIERQDKPQINQQFGGLYQPEANIFKVQSQQEQQIDKTNKNVKNDEFFIKPQPFKQQGFKLEPDQVESEFFFADKVNFQSEFVDPLNVQNLQNIQNLNNLNQKQSVDSLYELKDQQISNKYPSLKIEYSQYVPIDQIKQANNNNAINDEDEEDKQLMKSVMDCKEFSKDAQNQIKNALDIFKSNREDNQTNRQKMKKDKHMKRVQITNNRVEQDNFFKQYILFTLETSVDGKKFSVERRYNHFKSLHLYFENSVDYYGIIKPTLPSQNLTNLSSILGAQYMDQQTLEQRKIDLENYINLYLQNDILKNDKVLTNFLEEKEFQPPKETQFTYIGWIQSMVENVQNTDFQELKEYAEAKVIMTVADFFKQGDNEVDIKEINEKMESVTLIGNQVEKIINFLNDDIKFDTEQQIAVDQLEKNFYSEYDQRESNLERQKDSFQDTLKKFKSEALDHSIRVKNGVQEKVKVLQEFRIIHNQIESAKVAQQVLKNKIQERFILKKMRVSKSNKVHEQNHNRNDSSEAKRELQKLDEKFRQSEHVINCIQDKLSKELSTFKDITKQRIKDALDMFTNMHKESLYNFEKANNI